MRWLVGVAAAMVMGCGVRDIFPGEPVCGLRLDVHHMSPDAPCPPPSRPAETHCSAPDHWGNVECVTTYSGHVACDCEERSTWVCDEVTPWKWSDDGCESGIGVSASPRDQHQG